MGVKIFTQSPVKKILVDRNGKVTGVIASVKGEETQINSRSVIITSGGFGGNKELLKKYVDGYNENMLYNAVPHQGDGLIMATDIGAATEGLGTLLLHSQGYHAPDTGNLTGATHSGFPLWVNKKGERFADETLGNRHHPECANIVCRQPEGCSYTILDESIKDKILAELQRLEIERPSPKAPPGQPVIKRKTLGEGLLEEAEKGLDVKKADSLAEIARWMGAYPEVLQATVEEYNNLCDKGYDEVFNKPPKYLQALRNPPYYAIKTYASYLTTLGGIKINHHMAVINRQGDPIPGLYAGGDCAGGVQSETYCMQLPGSAFSFAINSGRIAGENAAKYAADNG
jgi:fumarate reductase flavoprotein subunit